jgi:hypothetical protein
MFIVRIDKYHSSLTVCSLVSHYPQEVCRPEGYEKVVNYFTNCRGNGGHCRDHEESPSVQRTTVSATVGVTVSLTHPTVSATHYR